MLAQVEQEDKTFVDMDIGDPICGRDFCDICGECLSCHPEPVEIEDDICCAHMWIIYLSDEDERTRIDSFKNA